ncbi:triphosphoribosyl-dephospho-CoA synthase [Oribacterium sp. WCC10]|uniref:triphosphoribosyl-dephospho-CoA synthase n=1 Tax=Oribacterium sp. WCC10 TaxID=1855343 RepID=UPI0008EE95C0|nr:triphosphoribosyl-dephospho-CoA synthase [Oribacterium sp. WCC10]SFG53439.1 holo-ACP synthase / triphosphoribosyl-dephospho-CoA synthase [Oribacterium sp. WCC10]
MRTENRHQLHNREELLEKVGWDVRNSLLGEVYATPKPGLVDRRDTGAHSDMNYETFLASTEAITPYLVKMFEAGFDMRDEAGHVDNAGIRKDNLTSEERVFLQIRKIGIDAENAMNAATGNVNTHRGMIFTMGILLAASGILAGKKLHVVFDKDHEEHHDGCGEASIKCGQTHDEENIYGECKFSSSDVDGDDIEKETLSKDAHKLFTIDEILSLGQSMTGRILEKDFAEMEKREPRSHGEKLYRKYGEKGIRGQAMDGFPIIRDIGIPAMRKYLKLKDDAAARSEIGEKATLREDLLDGEGRMRDEHFENAVNISTLIEIMSKLSDTNVLTRSSYEDMEWLKSESKRIVELGAIFSSEGVSSIEELNVKCIEKNISPGGAADILAVTILLLKLEEYRYV